MSPRLTLAILCLLAAACLLPSCSPFRKKKPAPAGGPVGQATLIGIIEMVNPEQAYVVIRCDGPLSLKPGTELIALSAEGTKSKLILSPERKGYYLTADVKEGNPAVTHLVLLPRQEEAPTPPQPPPANPAPAPQPAPPAPTLPLDPLSTPPLPTPATPAPAPPAPAPTLKVDDLEPPVGNP